MNDKRPVIKIKLTLPDRAIQLLTLGILAFMWGFVIKIYGSLPHIIPIHYNISGKPDGYGSKAVIWLLPIIATVLYAILAGMNLFPHLFNLPVKITEENAEVQYRLATRMVRVITLMVVIIFATITMGMAWSMEGIHIMGWWFIPTALLITFLPLVIYMVVAVRKNKQ